jgi:hemerythrin-like metal-binding protein
MDFFEIFPWNSHFDTKIPVLDKQHKKLVDILNHLAADLVNNSETIILSQVFDELMDYANYHFKTEEKIWQKVFKNDRWFVDHEHSHEAFISELHEFKINADNKPYDDLIHQMISFLVQWLVFHILDTDQRMAKAIWHCRSGCALKDAKQQAESEMNGQMQILIRSILKMYDSLSIRTIELMRERKLRKQAEQALLECEQRCSNPAAPEKGKSDNN